MSPIYVLADEIGRILAEAGEHDGELTPELIDRLKAGIPEEIKRLQAGMNTLQNNEDRLKDRMLEALKIAGMQEIETPLFKVYRQRNPLAVDYVGDDPAALPPELKCVTTAANTAAVLEMAKKQIEPWKDKKGKLPEGFDVAGACELPEFFQVKSMEHLRIK